MDTIQNELSVEDLRRELANLPLDRERTTAERLAAVKRGKQFRPYYLVVRLAETGGGILLAQSPVNFRTPLNGAPFRLPLFAAMSDAHKSTALFNIVRRRYLARGQTEESMLTSPQRALLFSGDMLTGANRVGPGEWFVFPEPIVLEKGEPLNLIGVGDVAAGNTVDMSNCFFVFQGELAFKDGTAEGELTTEEKRRVLDQIETTRQRNVIVSIEVDFANPDTYTSVPLPNIGEDALLLGFASGTPEGGAANYLRWCTVDIADARNSEWSNAPIPITALASTPFDGSNTQQFWRYLRTPYHVRPGNEQILLTLAKRAVVGAAPAYPPDTAVDTTGTLLALLRTV